jgi:hypothetical protein
LWEGRLRESEDQSTVVERWQRRNNLLIALTKEYPDEGYLGTLKIMDNCFITKTDISDCMLII